MHTINDIFRRACYIGVSLIAFQEYVGGVVKCTGPSMTPTIKTKDIMLTDNLTPRFGKIEKGDIVIVRSPLKRQYLCKRVVGVSGDEVLYKGQAIEIANGYVWIEGDNKADSTDSRDFGPIPLKEVKRRCLWKIWPLFETSEAKN